jgi:pimeloyl-ACP methyl ester carboxylesterase
VAAGEYPFIPTRLLMRDKYDSGRYAPRVTAPTLILEAADDEVVPRSSTDRLFSRFQKGVVGLILVPGAGHNTISDSANYLDHLKNGR